MWQAVTRHKPGDAILPPLTITYMLVNSYQSICYTCFDRLKAAAPTPHGTKWPAVSARYSQPETLTFAQQHTSLKGIPSFNLAPDGPVGHNHVTALHLEWIFATCAEPAHISNHPQALRSLVTIAASAADVVCNCCCH